MSNGNTKRRCSCYHQTRTHAEGSGACRGLSAEQQRSCYCGGTYRTCTCPPRKHEPCPCEGFELAAVRAPGGVWMVATEDGPVCGAQFPGTTYRCGLTVHAAGRCHALDTTLEWHRQPVEALDREGLKALAHALLGRDEAVAS